MRTLFAALAFLSFSSIAQAGPIEDWAKAEEQVQAAWDKLPLTPRKITFITEPPAGYGIYNIRLSNVFKPTEKIITYFEPIGYAWKKLPSGLYEIGLTGDIAVKSADGKVLWEKKGFAQNTLQGYNPAREFMMHYTLTLNNATAGRYVVAYTLTDVNNGKTTSFEQDFTINE